MREPTSAASWRVVTIFPAILLFVHCTARTDLLGPTKALGATCATNAECSEVCIGGRCAQYASEGQPCAEAIDCAGTDYLCPAGFCVAAYVCGNGLREAGEICDDNNTETEIACVYGVANCLACTADCMGSLDLTGPICGDGSVELAHEECDAGAADSADCDYLSGSESEACTGVVCGDGYRNEVAGEECDDDNTLSGDGCSMDCQMELQFSPPFVLHGAGTDWFPAITTDGAGAWLAVWSSDVHPEVPTSLDTDIFYARSLDHGLTWSAAAPLNSNAASDNGDDRLAQITTDGAGSWVAVWASRDNLGGTVGGDDDIIVSTSIDNGGSWSEVAPLNTNAHSDSGDDWYPEIVTDNAGNWVAVWRSTDELGGTVGGDDDIFVSTSTDNGLSWSEVTPLNSNAGSDSGDDRYPQIATDGAGNWVAVWQSNDDLAGAVGGDEDILVSTSIDNGASWGQAAPLNSNAGSDSGWDWSPQITTDGAGNWVAVWSSWDDLGATVGADMDIFVSTSIDNGANWSQVAPLNSNAGSDSGKDDSPQITTDGAGNWVVVWTSGNDLGATVGGDDDIFVSTSIDNGVNWTQVAPVNSNAVSDNVMDLSPQIATDGAGNWGVAWFSWDDLGGTIGKDTDIFVATSINNGAGWSQVVPLNSNAASDGGWADSPQIAADRAGNWVAAWSSRDDLGGTVGTDTDIFVSTSTDNGASWSQVASLNSNAGSDSEGDDFPQITTDGAGNWVAVWQSRDDHGGTVGTDTDIFVSTSIDTGASWSQVVPLNSNAGSDSGEDVTPQIATDGAGKWVAVWNSWDDLGATVGTDMDIFVSTSIDNGGSWSQVASLNSNAGSDGRGDETPQITTDGGGNWVAVWQSRDDLGGTVGTDMDIFVSTSIDNGASWSQVAPLNSNADSDSGGDVTPQIATDGVGNWVALWDSGDDLAGTVGTDTDIFVSTSIDNGASWSQVASLNSNAGSDIGWDDSPQITTDSTGNWVAAWRSTGDFGGAVGTDGDIFVSTSIDDGVSWSQVASLNSNAAFDSGWDDSPQIKTDSAGNWVAVWRVNGKIVATTALFF